MSLFDTSVLSGGTQGRATRGRVPIYRPLLKGEEFDILVTEATFNFNENQHDLAVLMVTSPTLTDTEGIANQPISFFFGGAPRTEVFNGYVGSVSEQQAGAGALTFQMAIMGTTKPLQMGQPSFWVNKSIPGAVQSTAYRNGLGFHGHQHEYVWPAVAQTNESDWQFITSLAKRMGWRVYTRYGVIGCYDPLKLLVETGAFMQLVSSSYSGSVDYIDAPERSLLEFQPLEASEDRLVTTGARIGYFHQASGGSVVQTIDQIGDFDNYRFMNNVLLRNNTEAEIYVNGDNHSPEKWGQQATARLMGNTQIYPGMAVEVLTSNTRYYHDHYNGRWLVRGVTHKMDRQSFQTLVALARPDSSTPIQRLPYEPFWFRVGRPKPTLSLVEDKWVSSWAAPGVGTAAVNARALPTLPNDGRPVTEPLSRRA